MRLVLNRTHFQFHFFCTFRLPKLQGLTVEDGSMMLLNSFESSFIDVKSKQDLDPTLVELKTLVKEGKVKVFSQGKNGVLC